MNKNILTTSIVALTALSALSSCSSNATDPYTTRELAWNSFSLVSVPAQQTEPTYIKAQKMTPALAQTTTTTVSKPEVIVIKKSAQPAPVMIAPAVEKEVIPMMPGRGRSLRSY